MSFQDIAALGKCPSSLLHYLQAAFADQQSAAGRDLWLRQIIGY